LTGSVGFVNPGLDSDADADLESLAARHDGMSAAEIAAVCFEAGMRWCAATGAALRGNAPGLRREVSRRRQEQEEARVRRLL